MKAIIQTPYAESVVKVGDKITGTCVTLNKTYTGIVSKVHGPIKSPDCGGYRYTLIETGEKYWNGKPVTPIVYAEMWVD